MNSYPAVRIVYDFKHQASATKKGVVSIEIYYKGKRKRVNTGVRVFPSQWNNRHGVVKSIDAAELNLTIHTVLQNITDWINQLRLNRESFSFEKLERYLLTERTEDDNFLKYVERKIDGRKDIRESTRRTQRKLVGSLKEFGKIMFFSEVTRVEKAMTAVQRWIFTAFSENPQRVLTTIFCLIHLKKTSISQRWR